MKRGRALPLLLATALLGCPQSSQPAGGVGERPLLGPDRVQRAPSLIRQAEERRIQSARPLTAPDREVFPEYTKREGLYVDVPFLSGRHFPTIPQAVIDEQFGAEIEREPLDSTRERIEFERVTVWLHRGFIYGMKVELPHPLDRGTALGICGLQMTLGPGMDATVEWRLDNRSNLRRLSLFRSDDDPDLFDELYAWKRLHNELAGLGNQPP